MRARNIKPGFFENEELAQLPFEARLLFAGLWCYADREGRFEWRVKRIKALLFPYDEMSLDVITCHLMSLHAMTLILQYKYENELYGFIPNFLKHQHPHPHEARSMCPDPFGEKSEIIKEINVMKCQEDIRNPDIPKAKTSSSNIFEPESNPMKLALLLRDLINDRSPNGKSIITDRVNMQTWAKQMDFILRLDSRPLDEVEQVIRWCQDDTFWRNNILSPGKLRDKYGQLVLKMNDKNSNGIQATKPQSPLMEIYDEISEQCRERFSDGIH